MRKNKSLKKLFILMTTSAMVLSTVPNLYAAEAVSQEKAMPKSPADVIDFSTWKLQMPIPNDAGTSVKEISTQEMMAGYDDGEYCYLDEDGSVVFTSPVDGFKTANTSYTRSELRELIDGKTSSVNWGFNGTHILNTSEKVTEIPSNGRVVVSQIHAIYPNGDNGPALVKVEYNGLTKQVIVMYKSSTAPNAADIRFYFDRVELNQLFDTEIKIVEGVVYTTITSEGRSESFTYDFMGTDPNWVNFLNYFKAGNYVQDSIIDYPGERATVKMYSLETFHDDNLVENVPIESLALERATIELGLQEATSIVPVFTPIDTLNKKVAYEVISGNEFVAVNKNGVVTSIKEGVATVRATSHSNPAVTVDATITVVDRPEEEVVPLYNQNFGTDKAISLEEPDFLISRGGETIVEVVNENGNNMLQVKDSDPAGSGKALIYFPEQRDTVTVSYKIRLDNVEVKDAGGPKAQGSYLYAPIGGKEGFLSSGDEIFRLRSTSSYQAGQVLDHAWVLTHGYLTPEINPEAANVELGEWLDVTLIITPNNGTATANTTDVYMNGTKVGHKLDNNKKDSEYVNQIEFYSGTKDLVQFSVDDIKIYSGAKVPASTNSAAPTTIQLDFAATTLGTGDSVQLHADVLPSGAQEALTYTVQTEGTLAVSKDGFVTAITPGTGVIRVASKNKPEIFTDYTVNVIAASEVVRVEDILLPQESTSVALGKTLGLNAQVSPATATEKGLKYEILAGSECVSVDAKGVVTPIQTGSATIRITSLENEKVFKECEVNIVTDKPTGTMVYEQDFSGQLDVENWTTATSNINNTENVVKDGAFYFKDNSVGGQPKAYITFEPQADTFTIQFKFKVDADTIYNDTKISALSSAFGTGSITSMANEAFRFKTSGSVESEKVTDRRFTYSKAAGESGYAGVPGNYNIGEWYTIGFTTTPDNGTAKANTTDIYINGEKVVEAAPNKLAMTTIDKFIFQTGTQDLTEYWVDDFKIWTGDYADFK